jgi:cytochrome c oxidase subunit 2
MINLLTYLVVILGAITLWRLIRVMELVRDLRGDEEPITDRDNLYNGRLAIIFMVVCFVGMILFTIDAKKYLLPVAASKHGALTDSYLNLNFALIIVVFFITQFLLFWYTFKYRYREGEKAYFYPDNHKLEFIWTVIPAVVLMGLIVYGLKLWIGITAPAPSDAMVIEIYGKQFDWTVRYSGEDNKLGKSNFKLITDNNPLGVDVNDATAKDDKIVTSELHIPVNSKIIFKLHSRDVIHSAYFPHLRAQMNLVPGMTTEIFVEPTISTDSMRMITGNEKFDYILLCNKICGVAHYNMKMKLVVESPEEFRKWYKKQGYVFSREEKAATPADTSSSPAVSASSSKVVAEL